MNHNRLPSLIALRAFEAVARVGSMKQASEELHVTPGAISQLIRKLEQELSTQLFERKNREIYLTPEGKKLKDGAFNAFSLLKKTVNTLPEEESTKRVSIACDAGMASIWLAPRLAHILKLHPSVSISIHTLSASQSSPTQPFDIMLSTNTQMLSEYEFDCIGSETFSLFASPSYLIDKGSDAEHVLSRSTLLTTDSSDNTCTPSHKDWLDNAGVQESLVKQQVCFGHNISDALSAAKNGAGFVFAPKMLVSSDINAKRLVAPFPIHLDSNIFYWLGQSKQTLNDSAVSAIIKWLSTAMKESLETAIPTREPLRTNNVIALRH